MNCVDKSKNEKTCLAKLAVGCNGIVDHILPNAQGRKRMADIGIVAGVNLSVESIAPIGGLMRIKLMGSSFMLHRDDAANVIIKGCC